jgi:hypothetical protein
MLKKLIRQMVIVYLSIAVIALILAVFKLPGWIMLLAAIALTAWVAWDTHKPSAFKRLR